MQANFSIVFPSVNTPNGTKRGRGRISVDPLHLRRSLIRMGSTIACRCVCWHISLLSPAQQGHLKGCGFGKVVEGVGFTRPRRGFSTHHCRVFTTLTRQSASCSVSRMQTGEAPRIPDGATVLFGRLLFTYGYTVAILASGPPTIHIAV